MEFKIGDQVKVINIIGKESEIQKYSGECGIVKGSTGGMYSIKFNNEFVEKTNRREGVWMWDEDRLTIVNTKDLNANPYRCPICNGSMTVPNGFYNQVNGYWSTSSLSPEKCRSCNGTGIVWSKIYEQ